MRGFTKGDLQSHILHLSWPMIIANILQNIAAGFEMYLLGKNGTTTLAAYSIAMSSVFAMFLSVHGGLINGAIAVSSRLTGSRRHEELNKTVAQMIMFGVAAFAVFALIFLMFMPSMLTFFGAKGEVYTMAKQYCSIMLLSFLPFAVFSVLLGTLRGAGDSITPLKVVGSMSVLWILLNVLFIGVLKMGILGAAITGFIIDTYMAITYFVIFRKGKHFFKLKLSYFKPDIATLKTYGALSFKAIMQGLIFDLSGFLMLRLIAGYGNEFIAAYGIVLRIGFFIMMIGWPIANSAGVVVGHNIGASEYDRAMKSVMASFKIFSYVTVPAAFIYFFLPGPFVGLFTADASVIKYASDFMRIMAFALPVMGLGVAIQGGFSGSGAMGTALILSFLVYWGFRIPAVVIMQHAGLGTGAIYWGMSGSLIFFGLLFWVFYVKLSWMHRKVM